MPAKLVEDAPGGEGDVEFLILEPMLSLFSPPPACPGELPVDEQLEEGGSKGGGVIFPPF